MSQHFPDLSAVNEAHEWQRCEFVANTCSGALEPGCSGLSVDRERWKDARSAADAFWPRWNSLLFPNRCSRS